MIVSNRVWSDSGNATNASGAATTNAIIAAQRYRVPQMMIVNHSRDPRATTANLSADMHSDDKPDVAHQ